MASVVPAVIPESTAHLAETLEMLAGWASEVQVDVVDGIFVPYRSWPYTDHGSIDTLLQYSDRLTIEVDLMVEKPERILEAYLKAGVARAVVHLEAVEDMAHLFQLSEQYQFQLGLSISNDTPLHVLVPMLPRASYVQLMGIASIGTQGQPFDTSVLDRITEIMRVCPGIEISIDGSVNTETIPLLARRGATRFVSGSAILKASDPRGAYQALMHVADLCS